MSIEEARTLWQPEGIYLNTASYGLPPAPAWNALQAALEEWRAGRTSWEHWNEATQAARGSFARLCGVPVEWVAVGGAASPLVGLVAASLPDRSRVLSTEAEFTSALWPFMAQGRGIEVSCVPVARLAEAIDARTGLVAISAVQSSGGEVADLEGVADAARHHGALTLVDATQACGWLPLDGRRFDALVCAAYKWLMSPRGTAFLSVRPELMERLTPHSAGWYAGEDPYSSYYGPPLRLAHGAPTRREPGLVLVGGCGAGARAAARDRDRDDPPARRAAREPVPGRPRPGSGRLGHRLGRGARRRGASA